MENESISNEINQTEQEINSAYVENEIKITVDYERSDDKTPIEEKSIEPTTSSIKNNIGKLADLFHCRSRGFKRWPWMVRVDTPQIDLISTTVRWISTKIQPDKLEFFPDNHVARVVKQPQEWRACYR